MAIEHGLTSAAYKAGEDLSSCQYFLVKFSAADTVKSASASTDSIVGILQNEPESGETAEVGYAGVSKVMAGADLDVGDYISADSNGKATPITGGPSTSAIASLRKIVGIVTVAASASEVGSVLLDGRLG